MAPESRWCKTCTILLDVVEEEHEETCRACIDSDENKDVVMEDLYFRRLWKAVQYKHAGVPVLDLVGDLDEVLDIQVVENEIERIQYEQAKEGRDSDRPPEEDPED